MLAARSICRHDRFRSKMFGSVEAERERKGIANRPETQRLLAVVDGCHWQLHHRGGAICDEILRGQEGAHLLEDVGPLRLVPGLGDAQALEEGHRLLRICRILPSHLSDVEPSALRPLRCGFTTNGKVAHAE